jgi:8-oxo-dGTP pyrophosphatase MutT (NUDIX family)
MPGWKTLSKEIVYETKWMKVRREEVIDHKGQRITYSFAELPYPAVIIVAVNDKGEIYLQKQYRYTLDRVLWEVPAGGSEGEDFEKAARRELAEEAGLVSNDWVDMGEFFPMDGMGNFPCRVFLARDVRQEAKKDDEEDIRDTKFFSLAQIKEMIRSNELVDCESIASISMAILHNMERTQNG